MVSDITSSVIIQEFAPLVNRKRKIGGNFSPEGAAGPAGHAGAGGEIFSPNPRLT
jgi:hypothetical protein